MAHYRHVQFRSDTKGVNSFRLDASSNAFYSILSEDIKVSGVLRNGRDYQAILKVTEDRDHQIPDFTEGHTLLQRVSQLDNWHFYKVKQAMCVFTTPCTYGAKNYGILEERLEFLAEDTDLKLTSGWQEKVGREEKRYGLHASLFGNVERVLGVHKMIQEGGFAPIQKITLQFEYE